MDLVEQLNQEWRQRLQEVAETKSFDPLFSFLEVHIPGRPQLVEVWIRELEQLVSQQPDPLSETHIKTIRGYTRYMLSDHEHAARLLHEALHAYEALQDDFGISRAAGGLASVYISLGNFEKAISFGSRSLEIHEQSGDLVMKGWALHGFGTGFENMNDLEKASDYYQESLALFTEADHQVGVARSLTGIASVYQKEGRFEEALPLHQQSLNIFQSMNNDVGISRAFNDLGTTYFHLGQFEKAEAYLQKSLKLREEMGYRQAQSTTLLELGRLMIARNHLPQAHDLLQKGLAIAEDVKAKVRIYELNLELYRVFKKKGDTESALHHFVVYHEVYRQVFSDKMQSRLDQLRISQVVEKAEGQINMMAQKNDELHEKNEELERLLHELKSTQERMLQQQKLASLGQMTAGIAHEIKNPLNFVNNFALMNEELVEELKTVLEQGESEELSDVPTLLQDLRFNAKKINEHGKRANDIVHSMMQLAREGPRQFSQVDINALVQEAMKLAYHGYRSESEGFTCQRKLELDIDLSPAPVVRQEIERVLINLFNNAFYAIEHRQTAKTEEGYLLVQTKAEAEFLVIEVTDNGDGVPEGTVNKIFDPFYTTKPTGEGTGLGLSMSHEIVVQGHQGTLQYHRKEEGRSCFSIRLPMQSSAAHRG